MKVETVLNEVEFGGVEENMTCEILMNAYTFDALARQYKDPIKAIIRELSTNAADSHVEAGCKNKPFKVTLPNHIDSHFKIRDYGTGMSPDKVRNTYRFYFGSDKQNTNKQTGCFGLGSKTPFAYQNLQSFNVTSYYNGTAYFYVVHKDEKGFPNVKLFSSAPTEEPNGVEVSFSVQQKDFWSFQAKAREVYQWFKVKPQIVGQHITFYDLPVLMEGHRWKIYDGLSGCHLIMGNIIYPIEREQCSGYSINGLVVEVPIGAVAMPPSRDNLEYNKKTLEFLEQELVRIKEEVQADFAQQIAKSEDYFSACALYYSTGNKIQDFINVPTYQTRKLEQYFELDQKVYANQVFDYESGRRAKNIARVYASAKKVFYVTDCSGASARVRYHVKNGGKGHIITITPQLATQFCTLIGLNQSKLEYASRLPKSPSMLSKAKGGIRHKPDQTIECWEFSFHSTGGSTRTKKRIKLNEVHYYVLVDDGDLTYKDRSLFNNLKGFLGVKEIYGITPGQLERVERYGKWRGLRKYLIDNIEQLIEKDKNYRSIHVAGSLSKINLPCIHDGLHCDDLDKIRKYYSIKMDFQNLASIITSELGFKDWNSEIYNEVNNEVNRVKNTPVYKIAGLLADVGMKRIIPALNQLLDNQVKSATMVVEQDYSI